MVLRISMFLIIITVLIFLEYFFPFRIRVLTRLQRWPVNLSIIAIDSILNKIIFPYGLIQICDWALINQLGILNHLNLPIVMKGVVTFLILDLAIYLQHKYSHKWNILWRFHSIHHADLDLDVTSALRFHPIEILYSNFYKIMLIVFFGLNPKAFLVFEIVLNSMAMFNHANIIIPDKIEKKLRLIFVTPQMHIIHHSIEKYESDTNFGFNFSFWDRIFKTYFNEFHSSGIIGVIQMLNIKHHNLKQMLLLPFIKQN